MFLNTRALIHKISLALVILICCATTLQAQIDTTAISSHLNRSKDKLGKNFVFLLYRDGKIIYKRESAEFNSKTQQQIGASSQWLTAALVMTFVQEGKLSLDDKVSKYLPIFEKYYKGYVTIRHCLTHLTGIQAEQGVAKFFSKSRYHTLEEEVNNYASKKEIETNAGSESKYSNIGFTIAGRVLEVITKRTFDRIMLERLSRPCGMRNTTFANEDYNEAINPATGARSSAIDYSNFLTMLLNKGVVNGKPVLTEASVNTLLSLQVTSDKIKNTPAAMQGNNYGLGEWIIDTNDKGEGTAFTAPSYYGTTPVLDLCRKYNYVIFTKELSNPPAKDFYTNLKATIDEGAPSSCR